MNAREEAHKRYDSDRIISEITGEWETLDDWGYADTARDAFIAGALYAANPENAEVVNTVAHALDPVAFHTDNPHMETRTVQVRQGFANNQARAAMTALRNRMEGK